MFYVIETKYVGPNQSEDQYVDVDRIEVSSEPARSNDSNEVILEGWCGTSNDWAVYAHGEYANIEAARTAILEKFGNVRDADPGEQGCVLEAYKPGQYAIMCSEALIEWAFGLLHSEIKFDTSDERIGELAVEAEDEANRQGYTLNGELEDLMIKRREALKDERDYVIDDT